MAVTNVSDYETRRLENIKRNQELVKDLGIRRTNTSSEGKGDRPVKRRKIEEARPTRSSARVASSAPKPSYNEDDIFRLSIASRAISETRARTTKSKQSQSSVKAEVVKDEVFVSSLRKSWTSWTPTALPPTRNESTMTFHFPSHPNFTPNKSPEEMLREGVFGGSYMRPLYSKKLGITISHDWEELPPEWTTGLDVDAYLTSPTYNLDINKFKVKCGQSIEEWEAAGWIAHHYDVRGWFQWYCRFYLGRRCPDDDRQISRWRKCVGENGRWRLALLRKYIKSGINEVFDDGEDEDAPEVSPVIHQTCFHWAYEVRQDDLDAFWRRPR